MQRNSKGLREQASECEPQRGAFRYAGQMRSNPAPQRPSTESTVPFERPLRRDADVQECQAVVYKAVLRVGSWWNLSEVPGVHAWYGWNTVRMELDLTPLPDTFGSYNLFQLGICE